MCVYIHILYIMSYIIWYIFPCLALVHRDGSTQIAIPSHIAQLSHGPPAQFLLELPHLSSVSLTPSLFSTSISHT